MASTSKDKENNAEVEGEKKPLIPPEKKGPENDIYRQVGTVVHLEQMYVATGILYFCN